MTTQTQLTIPITSSLVAAVQAAMGIASWLENTGRDITGDQIEVQFANIGHSIVISTPAAISSQLIQPEHYQPPLVRWILTAKNGPAPKGVAVMDYEAERQHNSDYYETIKRLQKEGKNIRRLPEEERRELEERAPRDFWPVAAMINQMGAISAYNKAIERWAACERVYPELVSIIWTMCSGAPGAIEQAQEQWMALAKQHGLEKSPLLPATQVVNPEQGKGANRPKADGLTIGGQDGFWLLEYFKFAGLYRASLPRTVQGRKDRKTYVVLPSHEGIALGWHERIFTQFQKEFWASSAIKMDILAALRYTAIMLKEWEGAQRSSGRRRKPSDYVEGFAVVSFKDLGSAVAVMNVATIGLPDWIPPPDQADQAQTLKQVIEDHQRLIGVLDEKKGEEEQLLRDYRDFLSSRDPALAAFFSFTTGYAGHVMRKLSKRQPIRSFTVDNLKEIIMANEERRKDTNLLPLSRIVETAGFRNIATAIRRSTVIPQRQKVNGSTSYDIRYGLADELRRKARNDREFISALSEFMQQYNQENKRVYAREKRPVRADITTQDITDIVRLIDDYDTPTIANLLIAFGYASDPKASKASEIAVGNTSTESASEDEETLAESASEDDENPF